MRQAEAGCTAAARLWSGLEAAGWLVAACLLVQDRHPQPGLLLYQCSPADPLLDTTAHPFARSVAVHQQCYGVHKVPAGKWLCEACKAKLKPRAANCCVCPVVGGAVKKVGSGGGGEGKGWRATLRQCSWH